MDDTAVEIAARLRSARQNAGLSQGQVARLLGLHRPTVTEIEAGRRKVAVHELKKLASIYRVSFTWLCCEDEDIDPRVSIAARELGRLSNDDLERVMSLLKSVATHSSDGD